MAKVSELAVGVWFNISDELAGQRGLAWLPKRSFAIVGPDIYQGWVEIRNEGTMTFVLHEDDEVLPIPGTTSP